MIDEIPNELPTYTYKIQYALLNIGFRGNMNITSTELFSDIHNTMFSKGQGAIRKGHN